MQKFLLVSAWPSVPQPTRLIVSLSPVEGDRLNQGQVLLVALSSGPEVRFRRRR